MTGSGVALGTGEKSQVCRASQGRGDRQLSHSIPVPITDSVERVSPWVSKGAMCYNSPLLWNNR